MPDTTQMPEVRTNVPVQWKGSRQTALAVAHEIARRWGEEEASKYDPRTNCFTFAGWRKRGYRVKRGEKAIKSTTFIPVTRTDDNGDEQVVSRRPWSVNLFYYLQVEQR